MVKRKKNHKSVSVHKILKSCKHKLVVYQFDTGQEPKARCRGCSVRIYVEEHFSTLSKKVQQSYSSLNDFSIELYGTPLKRCSDPTRCGKGILENMGASPPVYYYAECLICGVRGPTSYAKHSAISKFLNYYRR